MKLTKEYDTFGMNIHLEEGNKYITFSYRGNLDLYITYHNRDGEDTSPREFIITKENYSVFHLFEQLFIDIDTINIFGEDEDIPFYIEDEKEKQQYLEEERKYREEQKMRYRKYNAAHYNDLYNPKTNTITWYSDETAHAVGNILTIKKEKEAFKLTFNIQEHIDGYDDDFHTAYYVPIRFRNSGSSYDPFNCIFIKMYNNMQEIDDIHDIGHQIHIEEYLYEQTLKLTKRK